MEKFIIKAGQILDCISGATKEDMSILVENDVIKEIKKHNELDTDCEVYDYSQKTVMPGLINCHVHLHANPTLTKRETEQLNEVDIIVEAYLNLQKYIDSGVTFIRNQGSPDFIDLKLKKLIESGKITGPSIIASGPSICMTGGHGHTNGLESDGPDECRKNTRFLLKNGVDTVKLMATGGVMTEGVDPGSTQLTYEELKAAIEEANKAGRPTSAHAQGAEGIHNAVKAGITSIEHGIFLTNEIIDLMLERQTYLVPTLAAPHFILDAGIKGGVDAYAVRKTKAIVQNHIKSFKYAYMRGVKMAMGTDAGTPYNMHEKSWIEFKLMVDHGMSTMEAIKTGTMNAAELLGVSKDYGSLEAGKKADIIVLDKNPLTDIEALSEIEAVFKHGKKVK